MNTLHLNSNFHYIISDVYLCQARIQTSATFAVADLEKFSSEKSGKHWIKSENRGILRRFIFFLYPRLNDGLLICLLYNFLLF